MKIDSTSRNWRKSSFSGTQENCVEIALTEGTASVRGSKNPGDGMLTRSPVAFRHLLHPVSR